MFKRAVFVCAAMVLSACGPEATGVEEADARQGTQEAALVAGVSRGCSFHIFATQRLNSTPPVYDIRLGRATSCQWGGANLVLGSSTNYMPQLALAANDLGVAVSYVYKNSYSGSSPTFLSVQHVDPETMAVVRSTGLSAGMFGSGSIYLATTENPLVIQADGTTLTVKGTKTAAITGETGSGSNYTATYADFFTSTTAPTIVAY